MSEHTVDIRRSAVPPRPQQVSRWTTAGIGIVILIVLHVIAFRDTDFKVTELISGAEGMRAFLADAFPPNFDWETVLKPALNATAITLWIGLLGTTLSIPGALLLAVLGSRSTSSNVLVYQLARAILSFFRAVPDVVFALIFVTAVGLGPFAGVLALICHNTGVMGKLWAESLEESDLGPQQALATAGATKLQQVMHASLPVVTGSFIGLLLYRFDVNVRSSLVLGLVGAGGIGLLINQSIKSFQFDAMVTQILVVLVLIILVDQVSAFIRRRIAV